MIPETRNSTPSSCPECEQRALTERFVTQEFAYGRPPDAVTLTAVVPVHECTNCGFVFTDDTAEELRHDAVCTHLGVLKPSEIRALRERHGLTRAEFARLTKIGEASLGRWESGALIQNGALDQYLRLLQYDDVMDRLRAGEPRSNMIPMFQCLSTNDVLTLQPRARLFALRK